jgi:hypothetical protein
MVEPLLSGIVLNDNCNRIWFIAAFLQYVEISSVKILQIKICKVLIKIKFNYF